MSQKTEAIGLCDVIRGRIDPYTVNRLLLDLLDVINCSQNRPPYGGSDMSIDENLWNRLRDFQAKMSSALRALESLK